MSALNILLVDNDHNLVTTLSHGLHKAMGKAISVAVCFSGSEALLMLANQRFDVVISDFNMPGISGLELFNKLQQDYHETILVLITAFGTDALEAEAHQLGIGYLTKPFGMPRLVQVIHELLQNKETKEGKENAPHILIPAPESNAGMP